MVKLAASAPEAMASGQKEPSRYPLTMFLVLAAATSEAAQWFVTSLWGTADFPDSSFAPLLLVHLSARYLEAGPSTLASTLSAQARPCQTLR